MDSRFDIVGQLPLEISQEVAQYLPLHENVAAQRVSRRWLRIFTETLKPLLQGWYGDQNSNNPHALRIPEGLSDTAITSLRAEQVDAYRTGRAFSFRSEKWHLLSVRFIIRNVAYADGVLAWIDANRRHVSLWYLETGHQQQLDSQDILEYIMLSTSLVAATSKSNRCYIWDRDTTQRYSFPIATSSVKVLAATIFGKIVVIQHEPVDSSYSASSAELTIWRLDGATVTSSDCSVSLHEASHDHWATYDSQYTHWAAYRSPHTPKVMFHHSGKAIILFKCDESPDGDTFYFTRLGINGQIQDEGRLVVEMTSRRWSATSASMLVDGCTSIWVYTRGPLDWEGGDTDLKLTYVVYDSNKNGLGLKETCVHAQELDLPEVFATSFFWNDVAYFRTTFSNDGCYDDSGELEGKSRKEKETLKILNVLSLNEGGCRKAQMGTIAESVDEIYRHKYPGDGTSLESEFFGDGRFLISCTHRECRIWCFEKHVPLGGEDLEYKKARQVTKGRAGLLVEKGN